MQRLTCYKGDRVWFNGGFENDLLDGLCAISTDEHDFYVDFKKGKKNSSLQYDGSKNILTVTVNEDIIVNFFGCLVVSKFMGYTRILLNDEDIILNINNVIKRFDDGRLKYMRFSNPISFSMCYTEKKWKFYFFSLYREVNNFEMTIDNIVAKGEDLSGNICYNQNGIFELLI